MFGKLPIRLLRRGLIVPLLLLAAACATPLHTDQIRESHQIVMEALEPPWSSIGRVTFSYAWAPGVNSYLGGPEPSRFHCTGTLVGPREVLTAAHCLWDERGHKWGARIRLSFHAGSAEGEFQEFATVEEYRILPTRRRAANFVDPRVDWAILTLDEDLGEIYGYLPVLTFDRETLERINANGADFVHAVYGNEEPRLLAVNDNCEVPGFSSDGGVVVYHCATEDGDSGSPILLRDGERYAVVAVHAGSIEWQDREIGVGVPGQDFAGSAYRGTARGSAIDPATDLAPAYRRNVTTGCPVCKQ